MGILYYGNNYINLRLDPDALMKKISDAEPAGKSLLPTDPDPRPLAYLYPVANITVLG